MANVLMDLLVEEFPDMVDYQYVADGNEVQEYEVDDGDDVSYPEVENISLHEIAPGIYAGMSQKTHRVFVYIDPAPIDNAPED